MIYIYIIEVQIWYKYGTSGTKSNKRLNCNGTRILVVRKLKRGYYYRMVKPLLFPIEIYNDPIVKSLNLCQAGLYRLLIEKYWKTGIPLPTSDYGLQRLANADKRTYVKYAKKVKEALLITMPLFVEARTVRQKNRKTFQLNAHNMRSRVRSKNQDKDTVFSDDEDMHVEIIPVLSPREKWNPGAMDYTAAKKAKASNETGDSKLFTDD